MHTSLHSFRHHADCRRPCAGCCCLHRHPLPLGWMPAHTASVRDAQVSRNLSKLLQTIHQGTPPPHRPLLPSERAAPLFSHRHLFVFPRGHADGLLYHLRSSRGAGTGHCRGPWLGCVLGSHGRLDTPPLPLSLQRVVASFHGLPLHPPQVQSTQRAETSAGCGRGVEHADLPSTSPRRWFGQRARVRRTGIEPTAHSEELAQTVDPTRHLGLSRCGRRGRRGRRKTLQVRDGVAEGSREERVVCAVERRAEPAVDGEIELPIASGGG
mmetsp:Transcript_66070/g.144277  ORF Transcript_66070/g.144277 Transcript_66070/m.144277 type:complete len:268 (+) Transcript_66070:654-1457(+)